MKSALIALLTICLCLPLTGDDVAKKRFEETKVKAENGNEISQYNLALMYRKGEGVKQDFKQAHEWFLKAAELGDTKAQTNIGASYYKGEGVAQNFKEAYKWYLKAASQGDAIAQCSLADLYASGKGIIENYVEAYAWAKIATANGHKLAPRLAHFILQPKMTPEQIAKAEELAKEMIKKNPKLLTK